MRIEWAPPRHRWPARCTPVKDGWVRWYAGKTRWVCSRTVPLDKVEDEWIRVKQAIDNEIPLVPREQTPYRLVLSAFLEVLNDRLNGGKPPLSERTYHNYVLILNDFGQFVGGETPIEDIGPDQFTSYARKYRHYKASGFDSVVSRVSALFRWAVEMEYIDRFRPGPQFVRPAKQEIRDDRIARTRAFTAKEIARLFDAANDTMKCWIALGVCAAFNNSDIANLTWSVIDGNVIDFRRRKTGKQRRVIPLPREVVKLLARVPRRSEELVFVTIAGNRYARTADADGKYAPSDSISRLFRKLMESCGMTVGEGRNFAGLRTSFANLAPRGEYKTEVEMIMGHAHGILFDHYLEDVGIKRLAHVTNHVWKLVKRLP